LVGHRENVTIGCGDANDRDHLETLVARIPRDALVLAYLDPEGLHLHFETIRLLAWHFKRLDLLLNVPVLAIDRAMSAGAIEPVRRVLDHPDPCQLQAGAMTATRIRDWFKQQLAELGYPPELVIGNEIRSEKNKTPQYDLILASRVKLASELYRKANEVNSDGQRGFSIAV
jgi:three-Cys-motif partner protein